MNRLKKHISLILIGIFIFPIAFQSIHTIQHHSHNSKQTIVKSIAKTISETTVSETSIEDEHCPICDYHFSINSLPEHVLFSSKTPEKQFYFNETISDPITDDFISLNSSRAPPKYFS